MAPVNAGQIGTRPAERPATFAEALRTRAFAVLFGAEVQSIVGDQLARVALAVLVFRRSGSAAATGLVFAATYLPAIVGSALLGHLADRFPRRTVMVVVDVVRAGLVAAMALPHTATPLIFGLLIVSVFVGPLFGAAEVSYLAAALPRRIFRVATGLRMVGSQGAQFAGFAVGGALVAALGPRPALAIDAATFVVSAALVSLGVGPDRPRPQPFARHTAAVRTASAALWGSSRVRQLLGLSSLAGFFVVPEGIAVPYAAQAGGSTFEAGLLLAALPLGSVLGVCVLVRRIPSRMRNVVANAMAVGCGLPLIVSGLSPHVAIAASCWLLSGALAAYQVEVLTEMVQLIPDAIRARSMGVCNAVLLGAQGVGIAVFGAIAQALTPARSVAIAGVVGAGFAALLVFAKRHR